jgi:hypothetical protein
MWVIVLLFATTLTTTTQSIAPRRKTPPLANECVYTAGQNNFIVRDSQSTRFLLLDDTIVSSCFCWERETGHGVLPASSTLGIMATSQDHPTAGVIGVGHGTSKPSSTCRMKTCVVDPVHLPNVADRKIMQTLSDLLHNAARLESTTPPQHQIHSESIEGKMYMIGGGGGTLGIALLTAFPKVTLDVAEREPTIVTLARSHFGFTSSLDGRLNVYNSDGRDFLTGTRGYYDVVIIDAIPNHRMDVGTPNRFVTYQFLQTAVTALHKDHGVVLSNCDYDAIGDVLKTFVELFGEGRVWYMLVQPPHHYLVLGFHFNLVTTVEESVQMSKAVLGDHLQFNRPEPGVLARKGVKVLCDPGKAGCVV